MRAPATVGMRLEEVDTPALVLDLDAFERNLECSLELYRDVDGDGAVGPGDPLLAHCAPD